MRKRGTVLILISCFLLASGFLAAAEEVNQLGLHPFYKSRDLKKDDLLKIANEKAEEVKAGFEKAGCPELYEGFMEQLKATEIGTTEVNPGDPIQWMMFKKAKQVEVKTDVVWTGKKPFTAYHFVISQKTEEDGKILKKDYEFLVPKVCGNISLKGMKTEDITPPPPLPPKNEPPTCDLKVSPQEIWAGQTVTLDASGSKDPEGQIASVEFTITGPKGIILEEKKLTAPPYIYTVKIKKVGTIKIKAVVTDAKGAQSSAACEAEVNVQQRGFIIGDLAVLYQKDPAWFLPIRIGYMYKFSKSLGLIALAGVAPVVSGDDDTTAFIGDLTLTYWPSKFFLGAGTGIFHTSNKTRFDLIVNTGYEVMPHVSLFIEGRVAFDEFDVISDFGRFGIGFRLKY